MPWLYQSKAKQDFYTKAILFFRGDTGGGGTESPHLNWFTTYAGKPRIEGAWHQLHGQPYLSRSKEYKREVKKKKTYITNNKHRVERLLQGLRNKNMLMFTEPCHHLRLYSDVLHSIGDCKAQSRFQQTTAMICIVYGVHPGSNHRPPTPFEGWNPQRGRDDDGRERRSKWGDHGLATGIWWDNAIKEHGWW